MTIYTLYKKVDRISGLHYLGMTTQDAYEYSGSGKYWKSFLERNVTDIETTIVFQTTNKKEFTQAGRYYSKLWNIVSAMDDYGNKIWANKIPETGGGPGWGKGEDNILNNTRIKEKMIEAKVGKIPWNKNKKGLQTAWNKGRKETRPDIIKNIRDGITKRDFYGLKNPAAIKTVYEFIHNDGRVEVCTPYELRSKYNLSQSQISQMVSGKCKSVKGWRLLIV